MKSLTPYFTVFTPTFNRKQTLLGVYKSLCVQTFKDFEWLIIDDGSTDGTIEFVNELINKSEINIRYFKQVNQGKHVAHNLAVDKANGELFLVFDSDDECVPHALEVFKNHWEEIKSSKEDNSFSTITALCMDKNGNVIGTKFPKEINDVADPVLQIEMRNGGDKWGVNTISSMRENKFPVYNGEKFIPESIVWNKLSLKYSTRFVNQPLQIKEYLQNGLTADNVLIRMKSPRGTILNYQQEMALPVGIKSKVQSSINFIRFSLHGGLFKSLFKTIAFRLWIIFLLPIGFFFFITDKLKY